MFFRPSLSPFFFTPLFLLLYLYITIRVGSGVSVEKLRDQILIGPSLQLMMVMMAQHVGV